MTTPKAANRRRTTRQESAAINRGIKADPDTIEITPELARRMTPAADMPADAVPALTRTRGPQKAPTKERISVRLDQDILKELRATGRGWQTLMNDLLRGALFTGKEK